MSKNERSTTHEAQFTELEQEQIANIQLFCLLEPGTQLQCFDKLRPSQQRYTIARSTLFLQIPANTDLRVFTGYFNSQNQQVFINVGQQIPDDVAYARCGVTNAQGARIIWHFDFVPELTENDTDSNKLPSIYNLSDLQYVRAYIQTPITEFNPLQDGQWDTPVGCSVRIEHLPQGWTVNKRVQPGSSIYQIMSGDNTITREWKFSAQHAQPPHPLRYTS